MRESGLREVPVRRSNQRKKAAERTMASKLSVTMRRDRWAKAQSRTMAASMAMLSR